MTHARDKALAAALAAIVGEEQVLTDGLRPYASDATEWRGLEHLPDAVVRPGDADEVAGVLGWCYEHDVPVTPRGGGTGLAGGAVPVAGGVVVSLERLRRVRSFEPDRWRMEVDAGLETAHVRRIARESGLLFPPDPGAAEQSQIGGNIATNAGGPHTLRYGVTRRWVLGLEAAVAPGELIRLGGATRKDVAGYDLLGLLVGSEGTLGIVTAATLALVPAPEAALPLLATYADARAGCAAVERVIASGILASVLEFLDGATLAAAAAGCPVTVDDGAGFMVIAEADGSAAEAARVRDDLRAALGDGALALHAPQERGEIQALWAWRGGVSHAVAAHLGGKVSEDVAVPVEHLRTVVEATLEIGARHGLEPCSWGHAGDGNVHATFMLAREDAAAIAAAERAAGELFELAISLGGTVSGEHGLGWVKRGQLARQWDPRALELGRAVKAAFDPKGLLNPGKKDTA